MHVCAALSNVIPLALVSHSSQTDGWIRPTSCSKSPPNPRVPVQLPPPLGLVGLPQIETHLFHSERSVRPELIDLDAA